MEKEVLQLIGKNIRHFRTLKGFSQQELEFSAKINNNYLTDIEKGSRDIKISTLCKIANALNVDIYELLIKRDNYESKKRIDNKVKGEINYK